MVGWLYVVTICQVACTALVVTSSSGSRETSNFAK